MVLLDSSVWISLLRQPLDLELVGPRDEWATCLPVLQEVLQGIREEARHREARVMLLSTEIYESPLALDIFEDAVRIYRDARRQGITPRSGVDCLIAAIALRHDLEVVHRDRDYAALARVSGLRQRAI